MHKIKQFFSRIFGRRSTGWEEEEYVIFELLDVVLECNYREAQLRDENDRLKRWIMKMETGFGVRAEEEEEEVKVEVLTDDQMADIYEEIYYERLEDMFV